MGTNVQIPAGGPTFTIPSQNDNGWGGNTGVSGAILALAAVTPFPKTGGPYTLTGDVNFGNSNGFILKYVTSVSSIPANAGVLRLSNTDSIAWRNFSNSGNLLLNVNNLNQLVFNGMVVQALPSIVSQAGKFLYTDGSTIFWNNTPSGTVTTVSVVTANGISGSVANPTTTPAITLTLGAITPSSVNASGTVLGSNLSGTNTGDQTITLTSDVTGSGTGTFATTLATVNSNVGSFTNANITVNAKGLITAAVNGTTGTVTSVAFSDASGSPIYTVSGSPVTSSGTLTITLTTQTANKVFAGPTSGGAAQPTFRSLVSADLPGGSIVNSVTGTANQVTSSPTTGSVVVSLPSTLIAPGTVEVTSTLQVDANTAKSFIYSDASKLVTTTAAPTNGQLLIGSTGAIPVVSTLTPGTAISVTNGAGTITIANTGVTSITGTASQITASASTGAVTLSLPNPINVNTTGSAATLTTPRNINGVAFDGSANITVTAAAGTLTGTTLNATVVSSSLTSVGTIASGVWNGTTIAIANGGTGQTTQEAGFDALSPVTAAGDLIIGDGVNTSTNLPIGSTGNVLTVSGGTAVWAPPATSGTVTSVSVVSANGFAGTVATATTTPAITISTTITGVLKGNGTAISAATSGTDYSAGTSGLATGILKSTTGTGVLSIAVAGDFPTLNQNTTGSAATLSPGRNINGVLFDGSTNITVPAAAGTLTGTTLNATVVSSSLTSVGTIATGVWNGTTIAIANGGTGQTTATAAFDALSPLTTQGDVLYYNGTHNVRLGPGTNGQVLTSGGASANPSWTTVSTTPSLTATQIAFGNGSNVLTSNSNLTWTDSTHTLQLGGGGGATTTLNMPTSSGSPGTLQINGSAGGAGDAGGAITVQGGTGGATNTVGGLVTIAGGNAGGSSTTGGVKITNGTGSTSSFGGTITIITTNLSTGSNTTGVINITTGNHTSATGPTGSINLTVGNATGISAGGVNLTAGKSTNSSGAGGNITITAGNGPTSGTTGNGGTVFITAGYTNSKAGAGIVLNGGTGTTPGSIQLQTASGNTYVTVDANGNLIHNSSIADQSYSLQTPSTGFSITIADNISTLILNPSGTLATGTVTMPANPIDGQIIRVTSSQLITALTVSANAGQSIVGAPTAITSIGSGFSYIYNLSGTKWFRLY